MVPQCRTHEMFIAASAIHSCFLSPFMDERNIALLTERQRHVSLATQL